MAGADLLGSFRRRLDRGGKLLVPYLMTGLPDASAAKGLVEALGAVSDAIELGIPYSDPLMDGPVIAAAGERALRNGVTPRSALEQIGDYPGAVPKVVMTYYNPIHRVGEDRFCETAAASGVAGLIVPDLPLEESEGLRASARQAGLAWIPLVAPTSAPERVERVAASATGFVYAVSTLGVTGLREGGLSRRAEGVVAACRAATDKPVLVGVGVSTPQQASEAAALADGVIVGSALVKLVTEVSSSAAVALAKEMRAAIDAI